MFIMLILKMLLRVHSHPIMRPEAKPTANLIYLFDFPTIAVIIFSFGRMIHMHTAFLAVKLQFKIAIAAAQCQWTSPFFAFCRL